MREHIRLNDFSDDDLKAERREEIAKQQAIKGISHIKVGQCFKRKDTATVYMRTKDGGVEIAGKSAIRGTTWKDVSFDGQVWDTVNVTITVQPCS